MPNGPICTPSAVAMPSVIGGSAAKPNRKYSVWISTGPRFRFSGTTSSMPAPPSKRSPSAGDHRADSSNVESTRTPPRIVWMKPSPLDRSMTSRPPRTSARTTGSPVSWPPSVSALKPKPAAIFTASSRVPPASPSSTIGVPAPSATRSVVSSSDAPAAGGVSRTENGGAMSASMPAAKRALAATRSDHGSRMSYSRS